jgi:hypothetical protein
MADNITLPGAGAVTAADDVSSVYYQRVKLAVGDDGSAADVKSGAGTEAGSLRVALPTDGTGRVATGLTQARISQTPTITAGATHVKDAVGGLLTFANAARVSGGSLVIQSVIVIDNSQQMPALDLVLFDRTFTAPTDNAVFAPSDAEALTCVGVIPISAWSDFSTNSVATRFGLGLAVTLYGTSLFGALVLRGATATFVATSDITVILQILQD